MKRKIWGFIKILRLKFKGLKRKFIIAIWKGNWFVKVRNNKYFLKKKNW
jgi:hypothetical protein